jgi:hypothetical protein
MKRYILLLLPCLFSIIHAFAQNDNTDLLVQSPDGKTVKLVWFLKSGNPAITGFDVKRKEGLGQWVKLNTEPILPAISLKKKLSIVESDNTEIGRIRDKQSDLFKQGKLKEINNSNYLAKLNTNDQEISHIAAMISLDYDIALIAGFGYVDHTVSNKTTYEYALFIQGTDILLDKVSWNYGEIPDLNVVHDITSRSTPGKNGITIIWTADPAKMKTGYVAGFNIYRQGIRLNEHPVVAANDKEPAEFSWFDKSAGSSSAMQYSISAGSLFGIEGIIKPYTYNPQDHPASYKQTEVKEITSLGYYFKEGIKVQWSFPKDQEHFLKGFYLEKDNMPEGYQQVSGLLDPSERGYIDKTPSPVTGYIRIRVVAVYNDKTAVPGIEKLYNYFPLREPPRPLGIQAKGVTEDKKFTVKLTWEPKINGDSATDCYVVYLFDQLNSKFTPVPMKGLLKTNNYNYVLQHGVAGTYRFYVTALSRSKAESLPGDTVSIQAPSLDLPQPVVAKAIQDSNRVIIQWQYPDVADLKGFRIYRNDTLLAGEAILGKNLREYTDVGLFFGARYNFTIKAVSDKEIISDMSRPATLLLEVPAVKKAASDYR